MITKIKFTDKKKKSWVMYVNDRFIKEFKQAMIDYMLAGTPTMLKKNNHEKDCI